MAETDLKVIVKAKELAVHSFKLTSNCNRYPKKYRHSLVDRIQIKSLDVYETLFEANRIDNRIRKWERCETITRAITLCDELLFYIELSMNLGLLNDKSAAYWSKLVQEVITAYLETLDLTLNGKTQIFPFKNGVNYLGFHTYITPNGKAIRKLKNQNKRNAQRKFVRMAKLVEAGELPMEKFRASYGAWKNHISHGNCYKLGRQMDDRISEVLEGREFKDKGEKENDSRKERPSCTG